MSGDLVVRSHGVWDIGRVARAGGGPGGPKLTGGSMRMIRSAASFAVFCGIALCASVGLAGSAFAEPVDGQYTATMLGGNNDKDVGGTVTWGLSGCGPDCVTLQTSGPGVQ